MISTLLLRLAGPMQSWGTQSRFRIRDTGLEPSKSGVIGLVCAALGRDRDEDISDLAQLRMCVRVDHAGTMACDYHTTGGGQIAGREYGVIRASGSLGETALSQRYYLANADFLVALEANGGSDLLTTIHQALADPVWPLFLGRKSFVPATPVYIPDGLVRAPAEEALKNQEWIARTRREELEAPDRLRYIVEVPFASSAGVEVRNDQPISFSLSHRQHATRHVRDEWHALSPEQVRRLEPCS